jgi:hypothetical protein
VAAVVILNVVLQAGALTGSAAFPVFFTLVILLLLNPLRSRLQALVDRAFYRTRYDPARALAALGEELGGTLRRDRIAALVRESVDRTVPNTGTRLFAASAEGTGLGEMGGDAVVPPALLRHLAEGGTVTSDGADVPAALRGSSPRSARCSRCRSSCAASSRACSRRVRSDPGSAGPARISSSSARWRITPPSRSRTRAPTRRSWT